eukprot:4312420-Amphidinium_carterae.2
MWWVGGSGSWGGSLDGGDDLVLIELVVAADDAVLHVGACLAVGCRTRWRQFSALAKMDCVVGVPRVLAGVAVEVVVVEHLQRNCQFCGTR